MNRKLISPRIFTPLVLVLMAGFFVFDSSNLAAGEPGDQPACKTAQEVIERNLAALGGEGRLRAVKAMTIKGTTGSALLTGGQDVTLYLQKPDMMKQEGLFQIYLYDGWRVIFNNGGSKSALAGTDLEEYRYRLGFYHNCFSLLKWEESFPSAVLEGVKRYGPARQYVVRFPCS